MLIHFWNMWDEANFAELTSKDTYQKLKPNVSSIVTCTNSLNADSSVGLLFKGWVIKKQTRSDL